MKKLACPCEYQDSRQILQRFARICYKTIKAVYKRQVMERQLAEGRALVDRPMSSDEICGAVCQRMGVVVSTVKKAQNLERFLRPYMEYLVDSGSHRLTLRGNSLCYEPVK